MLLKDDKSWDWTQECEEASIAAKKLLTAAPVLVNYDPSLPIRTAGDALAYGFGAVISHILPNGQECPIAYASCTLSASERNYAQIEKEVLSLVFGVQKFHTYLHGRRFTLVTDHKLFITVGPKEQNSSHGLQRWALLLSAYIYDVEFKRTQDHANAD